MERENISRAEAKAAYDAAYRLSNKSQLSASKAAYRALNKEKIASLKASWYIANKDRLNQKQAEWRALNKERSRLLGIEWRSANKEKHKLTKVAWRAIPENKFKSAQYTNMRRKGYRVTPISKSDLDLLFLHQNETCAYHGLSAGCLGLLIRGTRQCHRDHKVPISREGTHSLDNIQFLCQPCNDRKGAYTDVEYRAILAIQAQE